ncbi:MAG: methyltransferase domain-containing protein [Acidimicrobiia bacterium]
MGDDGQYGLGYGAVDDDANVSVLLSAMDATAGWEATRRLRAWEREQLGLTPGQRLLDLGCGLGDAALALGTDLGASGEIVGIDASAAMVAAARARARDAVCRTRFEVGDAAALDEPADSCDVVRCERTLQWLADPVAAVTGMAKIVRPGGLISLLDSDWSTFELDVGDADVTTMVHAALQTERGRPSNVGRRLTDLAIAAGLEVVGHTQATHRSTGWDPDSAQAPAGCFSMASLAANLVETGHLAAARQGWFVETVHAAARAGRFAMALTMFAVVARRPSDPPRRC